MKSRGRYVSDTRKCDREIFPLDYPVVRFVESRIASRKCALNFIEAEDLTENQRAKQSARDRIGKIIDQLITEFANLTEGRKKGSFCRVKFRLFELKSNFRCNRCRIFLLKHFLIRRADSHYT